MSDLPQTLLLSSDENNCKEDKCASNHGRVFELRRPKEHD